MSDKELTVDELKGYGKTMSRVESKAYDIVDYFEQVFNKETNGVSLSQVDIHDNSVIIAWDETYYDSCDYSDVVIDCGYITIDFEDYVDETKWRKIIDDLK